jgi:ABC-type Zn uptake system ZnuABC Zn-binding protein ZnuA
MKTSIVASIAVTIAASVTLGACAPAQVEVNQDRPTVVATSSIVADFVDTIAGDHVELITLVPNRVDTHTYEPAPGELRSLERADLVVLADRALNPSVTQIVTIAVDAKRIVELNAGTLDDSDYLYRDPHARVGRNVHTWTDPTLAAKWVDLLAAQLSGLVPHAADDIARRAAAFTAELTALDLAAADAVKTVETGQRKLVVYHDAWEYFGRRYGFSVIGALQAVDLTEPSAADIAAMADQIRAENVPAFFGSEVFTSDVMSALERESGARYVPDLADDALPGRAGEPEHRYTEMMRRNVALIVTALGGS